jgi:hypothetical protein
MAAGATRIGGGGMTVMVPLVSEIGTTEVVAAREALPVDSRKDAMKRCSAQPVAALHPDEATHRRLPGPTATTTQPVELNLHQE